MRFFSSRLFIRMGLGLFLALGCGISGFRVLFRDTFGNSSRSPGEIGRSYMSSS